MYSLPSQVFLFFGSACMLLQHGSPEEAKRHPYHLEKIRFETGFGSLDQSYISTHLRMGIGEGALGDEMAFGAMLFARVNKNFPFSHDMTLPPVRDGDIVPVYGHLYRVSKITKGQKNPNPTKLGGAFVLEWIKDDQMPGKPQLKTSAIVIPLQRVDKTAAITMYDDRKAPIRSLQLLHIDPEKAPGEGLRAWIYVGAEMDEFGKSLRQEAHVRQGDVLVLKDKGYIVRNIVPYDAKTQVIGWVELEAKSIPEGEFKNQKSVIRPTPRLEQPPP